MALQQNPIDGNVVPEREGEDFEIAKFWANRKGEAIIVKLTRFENRWFVDARRYYTDKQGKLAPTVKGVTLVVRKLPDLLKALGKAEGEARTRGLLRDGGDE